MKRSLQSFQGNPSELGQNITRLVEESNVLRPGASTRTTLFSEKTQTVAQTGETIAKRLRVDPPFSGMPGGGMLNGMNFEPLTGSMSRPGGLQRAYFNDGEDTQRETHANSEVVIHVNVRKPPGRDQVPPHMLGDGHWLLVRRTRDAKALGLKSVKDSVRDVDMSTVSYFNFCQIVARAPPSGEEKVDEKICAPASQGPPMDTFVHWGVQRARDSVYTQSTRGLTTTTTVVRGVHNYNCVNYWAHCYPQSTRGAYGYWLWTRRPRDPEKYKEYMDVNVEMTRLLCIIDPTKQIREQYRNLARKRIALDDALKTEDDYVWLLEPAVAMGRSAPPQFLTTGHNWSHQGKAIRCVQFVDGTTGLDVQTVYRDAITAFTFPRDIKDLEDNAKRSVPRCSLHLVHR